MRISPFFSYPSFPLLLSSSCLHLSLYSSFLSSNSFLPSSPPLCSLLILILILPSSSDRGASLGISHNINISPWGEYSPGYLYYALAFSLSQSALILTLFTAHKLFDMSYATRLYKWKSTVTAIGMFLLHFIYLPVNLTLFRLYYCSSGVLAADPTVVCGASDHSMITAICSFLVLPVTIGLPIRMYWFIHVRVRYQCFNFTHFYGNPFVVLIAFSVVY